MKKQTFAKSLLSVLICGSVLLAGQTTPPAPKSGQAPKSKAVRPGGAVARTIHQIKTPPLPPFNPQQPKRIELKNGMVIFLQEDHELPLIEGFARIKGGGREVPAEKAGLPGIYGSTWRTGGTKTKTGDELDNLLEAKAASIETGAGLDSASISFSSLKADFDAVFAIAVELLREPEFRQEKVDLAKQQASTGISRRNDDSSGIASREARRLGYGKDSPYARQPEYWTIAAINRQDLIELHKKYVHPNNIILGVVGDFDTAAMEAKLRKHFEGWEPGPKAVPIKTEFRDVRPGVYFVSKDDVTQSSINFVALGLRRDTPDFYAITVMNELFGGGSSARLFSNIRTKKGLAYSVGGGLRTNFDHPGLFQLGMGTKSETTAEAIDALYIEIKNLQSNPGTDQEVQRAKDNILNSFVFNFDSKDKVLQEKMTYEFYGYPADYLERFRKGIEKITPADVARVVQKYVDPKKFAVLVVGKEADFDKPLSTFGTVEKLDITIPTEAPGAAKPAGGEAGASNPEGKALLAKVVEGLGGAAKVDSVKSLQTKITSIRHLPQGTIEIEVDYTMQGRDHTHAVMRLPMGEMMMAMSPKGAFMVTPQGVGEMPPPMKTEQTNNAKRFPLWVAQHRDDPKYTFTANGTEKVGEIEAAILDVNADGAAVRWFVDPASGRIIKSTFKGMGQAGPTTNETMVQEFAQSDGITYAVKMISHENGKLSANITTREFKVNPVIDPKIFEKPAP